MFYRRSLDCKWLNKSLLMYFELHVGPMFVSRCGGFWVCVERPGFNCYCNDFHRGPAQVVAATTAKTITIICYTHTLPQAAFLVPHERASRSLAKTGLLFMSYERLLVGVKGLPLTPRFLLRLVKHALHILQMRNFCERVGMAGDAST